MQTSTDKAHDDLNNLADNVKGGLRDTDYDPACFPVLTWDTDCAGAGKNIKSDVEHGMQDANAKARTNTDKAAAQGQNAYQSAADKGANLAQNTANKLDTAK